MIVKDVMTKHVATCAPTDDLATVAYIMQERRCGFVPVVESHGLLAGVITDRDGLLAASSRVRRPVSRIAVSEAMSQPVYSCFSDENLKAALATMAKHHVRRLPVVDKRGHLEGVLSLEDIALSPRRRGAPTAEDVVDTLKAICARREVEAIPS